MEAGIHLPLIDVDGEGLSFRRLAAAVDAARGNGFVAVSVNDHFLFPAPWLDGLTALAAVVERTGDLTLATTLALASLRGPVPLAKALTALDVLSGGGRVVAGVGPGSSRVDYDAVGVPFDGRWRRFDVVVGELRRLLGPDSVLGPAPARRIPVWLGSWGSPAGMRRVVRLGDGWLASAYNTTPELFAAGLRMLSGAGADFPHALVTMWTWVTDSASDTERVLGDVLGPLVRRDPAELRGRLCVGSPEQCAELLSSYAEAGCRRVHFWPLGDEPRQIERLARDVLPRVADRPRHGMSASATPR